MWLTSCGGLNIIFGLVYIWSPFGETPFQKHFSVLTKKHELCYEGRFSKFSNYRGRFIRLSKEGGFFVFPEPQYRNPIPPLVVPKIYYALVIGSSIFGYRITGNLYFDCVLAERVSKERIRYFCACWLSIDIYVYRDGGFRDKVLAGTDFVRGQCGAELLGIVCGAQTPRPEQGGIEEGAWAQEGNR